MMRAARCIFPIRHPPSQKPELNEGTKTCKNQDNGCELIFFDDVYQLPMSENNSYRTINEPHCNTNEEADTNKSSHLMVIRDLLFDIKDLTIVMLGYLRKKEQLISNSESQQR